MSQAELRSRGRGGGFAPRACLALLLAELHTILAKTITINCPIPGSHTNPPPPKVNWQYENIPVCQESIALYLPWACLPNNTQGGIISSRQLNFTCLCESSAFIQSTAKDCYRNGYKDGCKNLGALAEFWELKCRDFPTAASVARNTTDLFSIGSGGQQKSTCFDPPEDCAHAQITITTDITPTPTSSAPVQNESKDLPRGAIAGIVIGIVFVAIVLFCICCLAQRKRHLARRRGRLHHFTVGWIAPLALELAAAVAMLEEHEIVSLPNDNTSYHTGRIGKHWVVVVVCASIGTNAASAALTNMQRSFTNLKHILVVGIAGGIPSYGRSSPAQEIVLGDVVVSWPQGRDGGVKHYEFGAWETAGEGESTLRVRGHLHHPSQPLRTAVNNLRSNHMTLTGTTIHQNLKSLRANLNEREKLEFQDQGAENDFLFQDEYPHSDMNRDCQGLCDLTRAKLRHIRGDEAKRETDSPRIHYGTIGSSNALVISIEQRNYLSRRYGILCFEMESAGIMNDCPALVIRGICDYADSHKHKKWQKYAAATAAAYAKEVLLLVPPAKTSNIDEPEPSGYNMTRLGRPH